MKSLIIIITFVFTVNAFSQIVQAEDFGFGGPEVKFTQIAGKDAILVGGSGGKIISDNFAIGGGGYGLATRINTLEDATKSEDVSIGYGGIVLSYFTNPVSNITINSSLLVGAGVLSLEKDNDLEYDDDIFVLEPSINIQFKVFDFMKVGSGISYRQISGISAKEINNSTVSGSSIKLSVMIGDFGEF